MLKETVNETDIDVSILRHIANTLSTLYETYTFKTLGIEQIYEMIHSAEVSNKDNTNIQILDFYMEFYMNLVMSDVSLNTIEQLVLAEKIFLSSNRLDTDFKNSLINAIVDKNGNIVDNGIDYIMAITTLIRLNLKYFILQINQKDRNEKELRRE